MEQIYGVWAVRSAASMFGHAEAWCKEDGRPLEFESLEAAQAYALELNRKATVNVRYFVKEKEPEPNAVRVPASQPDIEAVGPVDHVPRNEVAEKHNEIPGRQMAPEADPVVEIRSAVHSNYANRLFLHAQFGKAEKFRLEPAVPSLLRGILASEQEYRHNFIPGVFENHLDKMIAAEKRSVTHFLKEAAANAPRPAPNKKTKEQPQR